MTQLIFDLGRRAAMGRRDFFVSASNASAVDWVDRWPDWPPGPVVLYGPPGCGKTHLLRVWCDRAAAVAINGANLDEEAVARFVGDRCHRIAVDDGDSASEQPLLHLHNSCLENRGSLLIAARQTPVLWKVTLRDLSSRLRAAHAVAIDPPDDQLLGAVLIKHFADRQLRVAPELVSYLLRQMERSFAAAADITARLDRASLRDGRAITVPLARQLLTERGPQLIPPAGDAGVK